MEDFFFDTISFEKKESPYERMMLKKNDKDPNHLFINKW